MTNPDELRSDFIEALRSIPGVLSELDGNEANVVEYVEQDGGDLFSTINGLTPPKLLVVYQGTSVSGRQTSLWQHNFSLILRPGGSPAALFVAIVNGIPALSGSDGQPLISSTINPNHHPMNVPLMQRRSIPVSESSSFDYWEITTGFNSIRMG